jgi:hypothetical protein
MPDSSGRGRNELDRQSRRKCSALVSFWPPPYFSSAGYVFGVPRPCESTKQQRNAPSSWYAYCASACFDEDIILEVCITLIQFHISFPVACSYRASTEVIRAVLDAYPEAAGEASDSGSFPLHFMCDYGCSVDSLRAIVQTGPGAASVLKQDRTFRRKPLQILNGRKSLSTFSRSLDKMRQARMTQRALRAEGAVGQEDELERLDRTVTDFRDFDFWQKTAILMLVEYQKRPLMDEDLDDARILQACIGITECPSSVQEFAILLYEDKLLTPDEDGQLPLHRVARDGTPSLLMDVLAGNTAAACLRDEQGLLPLEIAVRHRNMCCWSDGLGKLVEANPSALDELKLNDRLYPKIWSQLLTPDALFLAIRSRPGLFLRIDSGRDGI